MNRPSFSRALTPQTATKLPASATKVIRNYYTELTPINSALCSKLLYGFRPDFWVQLSSRFQFPFLLLSPAFFTILNSNLPRNYVCDQDYYLVKLPSAPKATRGKHLNFFSTGRKQLPLVCVWWRQQLISIAKTLQKPWPHLFSLTIVVFIAAIAGPSFR